MLIKRNNMATVFDMLIKRNMATVFDNVLIKRNNMATVFDMLIKRNNMDSIKYTFPHGQYSICL